MTKAMKSGLSLCVMIASVPTPALFGATRTVGPGKEYAAPCAAIAAASPGDVIEIDATGKYDGDVCGWTKSGLTLRGIGGRPKIDAAGRSAQGKGTWVISGDDTTVENIEFTGAAVADRNGAGIRQEGRNLTIRNCYFHHNENGILSGNSPASHILIEYSEFAYNGAGDGFSHNFYINHVARLTLRFSYSHHANGGHLVKTRAAENYILYNRLTEEADGKGSYEINVPNGGRTFIVGNVVQQGPATANGGMITYHDEGPHAANPDTSLFVINNTIVNDRQAGNPTLIAIGSGVEAPAMIRNNIIVGRGGITSQANAALEGNVTANPMFGDAAAYDYRLRSGSPAIDAGVDAGEAGGIALAPSFQYVHPACSEARSTVGSAADAGAFEFQGAAFDPSAPARCRRIKENGVVNGANFIPGPIAPASLVTVFGSNLATAAFAAEGLPLPQVLGTTSVKVSGLPAALFSVAPSQINLLAPDNLPPGAANVVVSVEGTDSEASEVQIAPAAPAIFDVNLRGTAGAVLSVYFTGVPASELAAGLRVTAGGKQAEVVAAEAMPNVPGVAIAAVRLPLLPAGDHPLIIAVGDVVSAPVNLTVAAP